MLHFHQVLFSLIVFLASISSCSTFPVTSSGLSLERFLFAAIQSFGDDDEYDHRTAGFSIGWAGVDDWTGDQLAWSEQR